MAQATVHSKSVVPLLLIYSFMYPPLFVGELIFDSCSVMHYFVSFLVFSHLNGEERACCFTLIVFPMSCDYHCSDALAYGAVGLQCVIVVFSDHTHVPFDPSQTGFINATPFNTY